MTEDSVNPPGTALDTRVHATITRRDGYIRLLSSLTADHERNLSPDIVLVDDLGTHLSVALATDLATYHVQHGRSVRVHHVTILWSQALDTAFELEPVVVDYAVAQ